MSSICVAVAVGEVVTPTRSLQRPPEAHIAAAGERHLLNAFWLAVRNGGDRLNLLLEFTTLSVNRPGDWDTAAVRSSHEKHYGVSASVQLAHRDCFACNTGGQLYAHHVIEIQRGGSNHVRNQVRLCFDCHRYLHPWLTEEDRFAPAADLESLKQIFERVAVNGGQE